VLFKGPRGPLTGPRSPLKRPRGPFKGPRGPLKGSRVPFKGPRGPSKGPRGPLKGSRVWRLQREKTKHRAETRSRTQSIRSRFENWCLWAATRHPKAPVFKAGLKTHVLKTFRRPLRAPFIGYLKEIWLGIFCQVFQGSSAEPKPQDLPDRRRSPRASIFTKSQPRRPLPRPHGGEQKIPPDCFQVPSF